MRQQISVPAWVEGDPNTARVLNMVQYERIQQDRKWGEMNYSLVKWNTILMEEVGELAQAPLQNKGDRHSYERIRDEAVQVAAVAVAFVESINRLYSHHFSVSEAYNDSTD